MAGYSSTPLPKKLGIGAAMRVLLVGEPEEFRTVLVPLPPVVEFGAVNEGPFDVIVLFCLNRAAFELEFLRTLAQLRSKGGLWVAWPKKSSGVKTDLTENLIRDFGLTTGLVDNKVCAITEIWSGLRFVVRVENRKEWPNR